MRCSYVWRNAVTWNYAPAMLLAITPQCMTSDIADCTYDAELCTSIYHCMLLATLIIVISVVCVTES